MAEAASYSDFVQYEAAGCLPVTVSCLFSLTLPYPDDMYTNHTCFSSLFVYSEINCMSVDGMVIQYQIWNAQNITKRKQVSFYT